MRILPFSIVAAALFSAGPAAAADALEAPPPPSLPGEQWTLFYSSVGEVPPAGDVVAQQPVHRGAGKKISKQRAKAKPLKECQLVLESDLGKSAARMVKEKKLRAVDRKEYYEGSFTRPGANEKLVWTVCGARSAAAADAGAVAPRFFQIQIYDASTDALVAFYNENIAASLDRVAVADHDRDGRLDLLASFSSATDDCHVYQSEILYSFQGEYVSSFVDFGEWLSSECESMESSVAVPCGAEYLWRNDGIGPPYQSMVAVDRACPGSARPRLAYVLVPADCKGCTLPQLDAVQRDFACDLEILDGRSPKLHALLEKNAVTKLPAIVIYDADGGSGFSGEQLARLRKLSDRFYLLDVARAVDFAFNPVASEDYLWRVGGDIPANPTRYTRYFKPASVDPGAAMPKLEELSALLRQLAEAQKREDGPAREAAAQAIESACRDGKLSCRHLLRGLRGGD